MKSENSKTSEQSVLIVKLTDNQLTNLSIIHGKTSQVHLYSNNKFKISASTWNDKLELSDGLYSVLDIQDYFLYI